jgi:hypothetical protein
VPLIIFLIIQRKLPAFFYLARPVKQHNHFSGMNIACARAHAKNSIAPENIRKIFRAHCRKSRAKILSTFDNEGSPDTIYESI